MEVYLAVTRDKDNRMIGLPLMAWATKEEAERHAKELLDYYAKSGMDYEDWTVMVEALPVF